jgi:hypothetical protein
MMNYRDAKQSTAQVNNFAWKALKRLHGLGAKSHTLDDVKQELWVAWCLAVEGYDAQLGAKFSTFLHRGMQLHMNRYIEKNFERFHEQTIAQSLDATDPNAEGTTYGEAIADGRDLQNVEVERENMFAYALTRLSPRAGQFLTLLKEQPIELMAEVRKIEDKVEYAKERGISMSTAHRLTSRMVFDFMGVSRNERESIMGEIEGVAKIIERQVSL